MNKKCNIKCMSMDFQDDDGTTSRREWEITADGKVWPCCKFVVDLYPGNEIHATNQDKKIMNLINDDPDWNNLFKRPLSEILNHHMYTDYISPTGWTSDSPPLPCQEYCDFNNIDPDQTKHASKLKSQKQ